MLCFVNHRQFVRLLEPWKCLFRADVISIEKGERERERDLDDERGEREREREEDGGWRRLVIEVQIRLRGVAAGVSRPLVRRKVTTSSHCRRRSLVQSFPVFCVNTSREDPSEPTVLRSRPSWSLPLTIRSSWQEIFYHLFLKDPETAGMISSISKFEFHLVDRRLRETRMYWRKDLIKTTKIR